MTLEEFSKQKWSAGMKCIYMDSEYDIVSVNFQELLIALGCGEDDEIWVRCENVQLIN